MSNGRYKKWKQQIAFPAQKCLGSVGGKIEKGCVECRVKIYTTLFTIKR